ncbi:MAG: bacteriohemerythrin [Ignavibacteriaceae bacterium]|jgi:hemerythrin-like metal-binding protein
MAIIEWTNDYSVGIQSIDQQHKIWIGLINKLHDAMRKGEGKKILSDIFEEIVAYTKTHLKNEEALFDKYNYPDTAAHKIVHDKLTKQVIEQQQDIKNGKALITMEVMSFLKNWLIDHIQNTDKKYSAFLISKGVK